MPEERIILPEPNLPKGLYRHYKGNTYEVLGLACHSETLEWHVIYKPMYPHDGMPHIWIRPFSMWQETVEYNGESSLRFTPIDKIR